MEIKTCLIETDEGNAEAVANAIPALCRLKDALMQTASIVYSPDPNVGGDGFVPVTEVLDAIRGALTPGEIAILATALLSALGMGKVLAQDDGEDKVPEGTTLFSTMRTAG